MQDICIRRNGFNLLKTQGQRYHKNRLKRWPCCDSLNSFLCTFYLNTSNRMYLTKDIVQFLCFCDLLQSNTNDEKCKYGGRYIYTRPRCALRCMNTVSLRHTIHCFHKNNEKTEIEMWKKCVRNSFFCSQQYNGTCKTLN